MDSKSVEYAVVQSFEWIGAGLVAGLVVMIGKGINSLELQIGFLSVAFIVAFLLNLAIYQIPEGKE